VLANRKGVAVRRGLKEAVAKPRPDEQKSDEADRAGRVGKGLRSPYPSKSRLRKSGGCAVKAVELTSGGLCRVAEPQLRGSRGTLTAAQESAEGVVIRGVGRASEALQCRKAQQQIGRAGNGG
jgi:hypothetical protein